MTPGLDDSLLRLGVHPSHPRALALLPLIEVAWADGEVQASEREAILGLAADHYALDDDGEMLLETWLTWRPSAAYLSRGRDALVALARAGQLGLEVVDEEGFGGTLEHAMQVAQSAGGWFGFRAVDASEREALATIAAALGAHQQSAEDEVDDPSESDDDRTDPTVGTTPDPSQARIPEGLPPVTEPSVVKVGEPWAVPIGERFTIGRRRSNSLPLPGSHAVSRSHAEIVVEGPRVLIRDLDSRSGTFVDGERIVSRRLFGGEVVRVGSFQLIVIGVPPVTA